MTEAGEPSSVQASKNLTPTNYEDDASSSISSQTQRGVKRIEAISQTWTQASLIAAYLGYVDVKISVECTISNADHLSCIILESRAERRHCSLHAEKKCPAEFSSLLAVRLWKCRRQATSLFTPRAPLPSIPWSPACWSFSWSLMVCREKTCCSPCVDPSQPL